MPDRDHLFISYASEDVALAEWLALRLTAEGYRVWIDRFELLGGEPYPRDVDIAIKERTFRLLALLSHHSIRKPNPTKERTLALSLARERNEDFIIPVNVDGLSPTELDWMMSDITFVPFHISWAQGLQQLLKKLSSIDTPRPVKDGRAIAADAFLPKNVINEEPEILYSNVLTFEQVPDVLHRFLSIRPLAHSEVRELSKYCPLYQVDSRNYLSFHPPPKELPAGMKFRRTGGHSWRDVREIEGIKAENIVSSLLRKTLLLRCLELGLEPTDDDPDIVFFPFGLLDDDEIRFTTYTGRRTYVQVAGDRRYYSERFLYHLAVTFDVRRDLVGPFAARFRLRLHLTDTEGHPIEPRHALTLRKQVTRTWFNHQWMSRYLAVFSFLAKDKEKIEIGSPHPVILSAAPITYEAPFGISERDLPKGKAMYGRRFFAEPEGEDIEAQTEADQDEVVEDE